MWRNPTLQAQLDRRRTRQKETDMFRKLVMMLFALAVGTSALTLTGCNTVSGAGKDVAAAGNKVTEEAQEHKKY
jgi:predicted small secreted protein